MPRTVNSTYIPNFLVTALSNIRKAQLAMPPPPSNNRMAIRKASLDALPVSAIAERKLVAHGAGVYEDAETREIWYKEGNLLKRRQADIDKLISDYLGSIK